MKWTVGRKQSAVLNVGTGTTFRRFVRRCVEIDEVNAAQVPKILYTCVDSKVVQSSREDTSRLNINPIKISQPCSAVTRSARGPSHQ